MKVRELIDYLKTCDLEKEVFVTDEDSYEVYDMINVKERDEVVVIVIE